MATAKSDSTKKPTKAKATSRSRGQSTTKPRQTRKPRASRPLTQKVLDEKTGAILMESVLSQLAEPQEFGRQLGKGIAQGVAEAEVNSTNKNKKEANVADNQTINAGETLTQEQAAQVAEALGRPSKMTFWASVGGTFLGTGLIGYLTWGRKAKRLSVENAALHSGEVVPMGAAANG